MSLFWLKPAKRAALILRPDTFNWKPKIVFEKINHEIKIRNKTAHIFGTSSLNGAEVMATDLRASVSLVLAGLIAENRTIINRIYHLDRGYESLETKLKKCNAEIKRV